MRYFYTTLFLICLTVISFAGLRGGFSRRPPIELFADMVRQPKVRPQTQSEFFQDQLGSRTNGAGTVPRALSKDSPPAIGRMVGATPWVETNPLPITRPLLDRGQERFQIFCSPCHGGAGMAEGLHLNTTWSPWPISMISGLLT